VQIISNFNPLLPDKPMNLMKSLLVEITWKEHIQRLGLTDKEQAIPRLLHKPPLINLKGCFENIFFMGCKKMNVLNRTFMLDKRQPNLWEILTAFLEELFDILIVSWLTKRSWGCY
jgi:hypothetical protein